MRLGQLKALEAAAGSWKDKDHPEMNHGAANWSRRCSPEGENEQ
jgi:hypothetical protein